jgi:hypothetical protein
MDPRYTPAQAAWTIAIGLLPDFRQDPNAVIPNDAKARCLRALQFVTLTEEEASRSKAARAAQVPWGTVASWIHRDTGFAEQVSAVIEQGKRELADDTEPLSQTDLEEINRIALLPEIELSRVAAGEVPSRQFMAATFPPGTNAWDAEYPAWHRMFPERTDEKRTTNGVRREVPEAPAVEELPNDEAPALVHVQFDPSDYLPPSVVRSAGVPKKSSWTRR